MARTERDEVTKDLDSLQWGLIKNTPGVYQLRLAGVVRYIGRARNVERRVKEHQWEGRIEFDDALATYVPEDELIQAERAIIRHFKPPLNRNGHKPTVTRHRSDAELARLKELLAEYDRKIAALQLFREDVARMISSSQPLP